MDNNYSKFTLKNGQNDLPSLERWVQAKNVIMTSKPMCILIVDDNPNDIELAKYHLQKKIEGITFMSANSQSEFREKYNWVKPDLVICDFDLQSCSGLDILIELRASSDVPFIFFSGTLNDDEKFGRSILLGANGYLLKDHMPKISEVALEVLDKYNAQEHVRKERKDQQLVVHNLLSKAIVLSEKSDDRKEITDLLVKAKAILGTLD